jgi:hypothetical protein
MSYVNKLLVSINEVHRLYKLQKAAEKAKVEQIRSEALRQFQVSLYRCGCMYFETNKLFSLEMLL